MAKYIDNYPNILNDILDTYFNDNIKAQIMTYYRIIYVFYVITKFIFKTNLTESEAKKTFIEYFDGTVKKSNKEVILNNINKHFSFYYKTFFIDENIYFSVYFNNLIKYFFPIPYEYEIYSPFITYRNKVNEIYKKNNIDYLSQINYFDRSTRISKFQYNINDIYNEIDIHIPLNKFNNFDSNNFVYYIGTEKVLYIAIMCKKSNKFELDVTYERKFNVPNLQHYEKRIPYELLFEDWKKVNKKIILDFNEIVYISVNRKISKKDIFNVFNVIDMPNKLYKYVFHDTSMEIKKEDVNNTFLNSPIFLYLTPIPPGSRITDYTKNRHCITFEITKDIKELVDLTRTIVSDNPLTEFIKNKHKNEKMWKSYDNTKILDYYEGKPLEKFINDNNSCLSDDLNENVDDFIKKRPYCDINNRQKYTGKRKFFEIIFKTRKYNYSQIWTSMFTEIYEKFGYGDKIKKINLIYHPSSEKTFTAHLDTHITDFCNKLEITGIFSTDHDLSFQNGGEIMLTHPKDYISVHSFSQKNCSTKKIEILK
jgi:hypothetical protein